MAKLEQDHKASDKEYFKDFLLLHLGFFTAIIINFIQEPF
jgi:hypothetical protein